MIRVTIRAIGVEGDDNLWLYPAHDFDNLLCNLLQRGLPHTIHMLVVLTAHHSTIAIAKGDDLSEANCFRGAAEFGQTQFDNRRVALEMLLIDRTNISICCTYQCRPHAIRNIASDQRTKPCRIVWMGKTCQNTFHDSRFPQCL